MKIGTIVGHWQGFKVAARDRGYLSEGRLQEVLALIQILGFGAKRSLTPQRICIILQYVTINQAPSAERMAHWVRVSGAHPEFFRVSGTTPSISLCARFAAGRDRETRTLTPEVVERLMQTAIDLHDREAKRRDRIAMYFPLMIAIIGALGSLATAIIGLR